MNSPAFCYEVLNDGKYDTTEYAYDGRNRMVRTTSYADWENGVTTDPRITQYYYDGAGNTRRMYTGLKAPLVINGLDDVTPGADTEYEITKYAYNYMNYLTELTDALGQTERYEPDYKGNPISRTDRNGDTVTYENNWRGQPLTMTSSKDGKEIAYSYDMLGNRMTMTDETGVTNYTYTNLSQPETESKGGYTKTYSYNKNSAKTGFILTSGSTTLLENTYTVTNTGLIKQAQSVGTETDIVAYDYDSSRNMTEETINENLVHMLSYNKANQTEGVTNSYSGITRSLFTNTYSTNGNITGVLSNMSGVLKNCSFQYDGIGRLTEETTALSETKTYAYDDYGNRTTLTKGVDNSQGYVYDNNNRLREQTDGVENYAYEYDCNGNLYSQMKSITGVQTEDMTFEATDTLPEDSGFYNYDGFNRLVSINIGTDETEYIYNGDGQRTAKIVNGTRTDYIWDGMNIVMETTGTEVTVYKQGARMFANEKAGEKTFYNYNAHGDVVQLLNDDGTVTKQYAYDAFGNQLTQTVNDTNPFRYCGEYQDLSSGLIYLRNRYYDPLTSRFTQEDPIRHGTNWYIYANNNPIMFFDPWGLAPTTQQAASMAAHIYDHDMSNKADAHPNYNQHCKPINDFYSERKGKYGKNKGEKRKSKKHKGNKKALRYSQKLETDDRSYNSGQLLANILANAFSVKVVNNNIFAYNDAIGAYLPLSKQAVQTLMMSWIKGHRDDADKISTRDLDEAYRSLLVNADIQCDGMEQAYNKPYVLCENGVLDLETMELCEKSPDYEFTSAISARYSAA